MPVVLAHLQQHLTARAAHQSQEVPEDPNYLVAAGEDSSELAVRLYPDHALANAEAASDQAAAKKLRSALGPALLQSSQIDRLVQGRGLTTDKRSKRQQQNNDGKATANQTT